MKDDGGPYAACQGKERFDDPQTAHVVAKRVTCSRARRIKGRPPAEVYRCPYCDGFHIGRPKRVRRLQ